MVIMRRELLACAVCFLVMIQIGCGSVYIGRESAAEYEVRGNESGAGNETLLAIDGVADNLRTFGLFGIIVPFIPFWATDDDKVQLTIYLTLSPGSRDDIVFDARQATVVNAQGQSVAAKEVKGPFSSGNRYDFTLPKAKAGSFTISKKLAVHLVFPIAPPRPGDQFTLVLKGLASPPQPLETHTLVFSKQILFGLTYIPGFLCLHCGDLINSKWVLSR